MNASFRRLPRFLALIVWCAAAACGGETSRGGSETNWFVSCVQDSDCAAGICACGICTDGCTADAECPGEGKMHCVQRGTPTHDRLCVVTRDAPAGLCLASCTRIEDCQGNEICADGACAPSPSWKVSNSRAAATGAPCLPDELRQANFGGFDAGEVSIESRSAECESSICLVSNFEGQQRCPYGSPCLTVGETPEPVTVSVPPQIASRSPADVSICSCRCDGPPGTGPFCACPDGFECRPTVGGFGVGSAPVVGSYCVKDGTGIDDVATLDDAQRCDRALANCEGR